MSFGALDKMAPNNGEPNEGQIVPPRRSWEEGRTGGI